MLVEKWEAVQNAERELSTFCKKYVGVHSILLGLAKRYIEASDEYEAEWDKCMKRLEN